MPRVCVLLANGFEEIEATTVIDVLRRAGVEVTLVGVEGTEVVGAHDIGYRADVSLADAGETAWDMVILPGGLPGAHTLRDDPHVQSLIKAQNDQGRKLAAICAAPIALGAAGVLKGRRATSYPGFEAELTGAKVVSERVVQDANVTTSQGPGTAMAFALKLAADLAGEAKAAELRKAMLI